MKSTVLRAGLGGQPVPPIGGVRSRIGGFRADERSASPSIAKRASTR